MVCVYVSVPTKEQIYTAYFEIPRKFEPKLDVGGDVDSQAIKMSVTLLTVTF